MLWWIIAVAIGLTVLCLYAAYREAVREWIADHWDHGGTM